MLDGPVVAGAVLASGAVLVGGYFYVEHLRHGRSGGRASRASERLPLFGVDLGPEANGNGARPASRMPRPDLGPPRRAVVAQDEGIAGVPVRAAAATGTAPTSTPAFAPPAYQSAYAPIGERANGTGRAATAFPGPRYADGETLRFALPDEGTLQFLPGRLQVVVGPEAGREIRFVRSPNTGETDVTFGRSEGPPHRHVQLLVPTVSRRHALMSLLDEHWSLQNLSATNPVTLNERRLAPDEVVPLLVDGDRIEMGEIVFVFHSR
ncbi:hypothetical protein tb265_34170 [Gemmatimonadetes bacterium T265]|nr:hypothetical protein tb265_34170 [Gemmatimonadetes bacterium T265]